MNSVFGKQLNKSKQQLKAVDSVDAKNPCFVVGTPMYGLNETQVQTRFS